MELIAVSTIQQYTIDQFRVSLKKEYSINEINTLSFKLYDSLQNDITSKLKSIADSNDWEFIDQSNIFNIYMNQNSSLESGQYTFVLYENGIEIFNNTITINYMEDIRISLSSITVESLDTIRMHFTPIDSLNPAYQTKKMLELMNLSVYDSNGTNYSDMFQSLSSVISGYSESDIITEIEFSLLKEKYLPKGTYTFMLTTQYKSRTFPNIQNTFSLPFLTTTPVDIGNCYISKNALGTINVSVIFSPFMEKTTLESATLHIYNEAGKEVTHKFDALRLSTEFNSTAGIYYTTRLDIPLYSEIYTLTKGEYTIKFTWDNDLNPDLVCTFNSEWYLYSVKSTSLTDLSYVTITFNSPETSYHLKKMHYILELDGKTVTDPDILEAFDTIENSNVFGDDNELYSSININICKKENLKRGMYTFILYRENDTNEYRYNAFIDIIELVTPNVKSVVQTDVDVLTIAIDKKLPLEVINACIPHLINSFSGIDYSNELLSIEDSNIWEPGQETTDRFNVVMKSTGVFSSGQYSFHLEFGKVQLKKVNVFLQYMETRKGYIQLIEQTDLSHIKIHFSETQTRKLLLATQLEVKMKYTDIEDEFVDYTDRFELLENVIKDGQYAIDELLIPMDSNDSLPSGKYVVSFVYYIAQTKEKVTLYSYDVDLGYMSSNPPIISQIEDSITNDGLVKLTASFDYYMEEELATSATYALIDENGNNVISKFDMLPITYKNVADKNGILYACYVEFCLKSKDETIEKGVYTLILSWKDKIKYLKDISNTISLNYFLPSLTDQEVTSYSPSTNTGRLYFLFPHVMQYEYFENLHVKVLNSNGEDHTGYFETIQESNDISESTPPEKRVPTDNINLNISDASSLTFGVYQFIFYHGTGTNAVSEYISKLDILAAFSPKIVSMEQVGINQLLVHLAASIPRVILENFNFTFKSFKNENYTDSFQSIDQSNRWAEEIREVSSFYIRLKGGKIITDGTYSFRLYSGTPEEIEEGDATELDQCDIEIQYMEGTEAEIRSISSMNLSSVDIRFYEMQSVDLFNTLTLQVINELGQDVSSQFESLDTVIRRISSQASSFDILQIKLATDSEISSGIYTFKLLRYNNVSKVVVSEFTTTLTYMSTSYPKLYDVQITTLEDKSSALILWFSPMLELSLFKEAYFNITNTGGIDVSNKLEPFEDAILTTKESNGLYFVEYASLRFKDTEIFDKDRYRITLSWSGKYSYLSDLVREVYLSYILFPVEYVKEKDVYTIEMKFTKNLKTEYLKNCELVVTSTYTGKNDDGTVITDVNFSEYFQDISETNDFSGEIDEFRKINIKLKDNRELPKATYQFIIAEKVQEGEVETLRYAYAGSINIAVMSGLNKIETDFTISQHSIDSLQIEFNDNISVSVLNRCSVSVTGLSTSNDEINYSGYFKTVKESNLYGNNIYTHAEISSKITDARLKSQYDLSYAGTLVFDSVYEFHKEALAKAGVPNDIIDKCIANKENIPEEYRDKCVACEMEYMLNEFAVIITESDAYLSDDPKHIAPEETRYVDSETGLSYYEFAEKTDTVIDGGIHYINYATPLIYLRLADNKAIPRGKYNLKLMIDGVVFLDGDVDTSFMTTDPPNISAMSIENTTSLKLSFYPYMEENTFFESSYNISTINGFDDDGQPIGTDMTRFFGSLLDATKTSTNLQNGIAYISDVLIPIDSNALLPSGKYMLNWDFSEYSYLNKIRYNGALTVLATGVKSVMLADIDTIEVIFNNEYTAKTIKSMDLQVSDMNGNDVTSKFLSMEESNTTIDDEEETDTFYIGLEEDEDVITGTYTFTLSYSVPEEITDSYQIAFTFGLNIVFMSSHLPTISSIDNLSSKQYSLVVINNDNLSEYLGRYVQHTDNTESLKEKLTETNASNYIGKLTKVYNHADVSALYCEFTDEVYPCLLDAVKLVITNTDGEIFSNYFKSISASNKFTSRRILSGIKVYLENAVSVDDLSLYDIQIVDSTGNDISDKFYNIDECNDFGDNETTKTFVLNAEEIIEEYEFMNIRVRLFDEEERQVRSFTHKEMTSLIETCKSVKLEIEDEYMFLPDKYTIKMVYENEPTLENTKELTAFSYTGRLPFISKYTNYINSITYTDEKRVKITFNIDLPLSIFISGNFVILNDNGEDVADKFYEIHESNEFGDATTLSEANVLDDEGNTLFIQLELKPGESLYSGNYTFKFNIDTLIGSSQDNEQSDDTTTDEEENETDTLDVDDETTMYTLWQYETMLPYMINSIPNAITKISQYGIDTLKCELEYPVDIQSLRNYAFNLADANSLISNDYYNVFYGDETFESLKDSNNFGLYLLLSSDRYIMYSEDGIEWNRFDTEKNVTFNDSIYDDLNKVLICTCSSGRIIQISSMERSGIKELASPTKKNLNAIVKINNKFIIVGNDGIILSGNYTNNILEWKIISSPTTETLTKVIAINDNELFAIGYNGVLIHSIDSGDTWKLITLGHDMNLNDMTYYNNSIYIVGENGLILKSPDNDYLHYATINSGTNNALFGISCNQDTVVAVGDSGTIITIASNDDGEFECVPHVVDEVSFTLRKVMHCDDRFIICGMYNKWLTSRNGENWVVNATNYVDAFRNIGYIESQYDDNRKVNYFYIKLRSGISIGEISFYSGYKDSLPTGKPEVTDSPAKSWISTSQKLLHVGDIYIVYDIAKDGHVVQDSVYQYTNNFVWEYIGEVIPSSGNYTAFIVNADDEEIDPSSDIETVNGRRVIVSKSGVSLNYMSTNPGNITGVELLSPDNKYDTPYVVPYLHVAVEDGNENAIHYASFSIYREDVQDGINYASYFLPLREGVIEYSTSLNIEGFNILGNPDKIMSLPSGTYCFKWEWAGNTSVDIHGVTIKPMKRLISSASIGVPTKDAIQFVLNTPVDIEYFTGMSGDESNLQVELLKLPTKSTEDTTFNFATYFKTISESTPFTKEYLTSDGKVMKFNLQLLSGMNINKGQYLLKLVNEHYHFGTESMMVTSFKFDVNQELREREITISSVKLEGYHNVVEGTVFDNDTHTAPLIEEFSGTTHPNNLSYKTNWISIGELNGDIEGELEKHVGDIYTNMNTNQKYTFIKDKMLEGDEAYRWELNTDIPHLIVTFGERPTKDNILRYTQNIEFYECDSSGTVIMDLTSNLLADVNEWDYDQITVNNEIYVSRIKIPFDILKSFPGVTNATFKYNWTSDCLYNNLTVNNIKTSGFIRDYGGIRYMGICRFSEIGQYAEDKYGITIKFEKEQFVSFLKELEVSITHMTYATVYKMAINNCLTFDAVDRFHASSIKRAIPDILDRDLRRYVINKERIPVKYRSTIVKYEQSYIKSHPDNYLVEEDISSLFKPISESTDFDGLLRTDTVYMELLEGQNVDPDLYSVYISGYKSQEDIYTSIGDPREMDQYDRACDGTLTFDNLFKFHKKPLERAFDDMLKKGICPIPEDNIPDTITAVTKDKNNLHPDCRDTAMVYEKDYMLNEFLDDDEMIEFRYGVRLPWITSTPPSASNVSVKFEEVNSVNRPGKIVISFAEPVEKSSFVGAKLKVTRVDGVTFSDAFLSLANHLTEYTYKVDDGIKTNYVTKIEVPMALANALNKSLYDIQLIFPAKTKLGTIPSAGKYLSFRLEKNVFGIIGEITAFDSAGTSAAVVKVKYYDKIASNAALQKSTFNRAFGWKYLKTALSKSTLSVTDLKGNELKNRLEKKTCEAKRINYTVKTNTKIEPGYKNVSLKFDGRHILKPCKNEDFAGVIKNSLASSKDKRCYLVNWKYKNVDHLWVFRYYSDAKSFYKKLDAANKASKEQLAKCATCHQKILLKTSTIRAHVDKYRFPADLRRTFMYTFASSYYKSLAKSLKCKKVKIKQDICSDDKEYGHVFCENYMDKRYPYSYSLDVATMGSGFPSKNKQLIYFTVIVRNGIKLARGYAATGKNKETSSSKKFRKTLNKYISNRKKAIAKCSACKKEQIAKRGQTSISWTNALFNIKAMKSASLSKKLLSYFNSYMKKATTTLVISNGNKKSKITPIKACSNAKFRFVKRDNYYCRLTCKNYQKNDKTLAVDTFVGSYYRPLKLVAVSNKKIKNK